MSSINVNIQRFKAWAPGLDTEQEWQDWRQGKAQIKEEGVPSVDFLPPMFRRRLSRHSKMALKVAHECLRNAGAITTVFCSRHGELNRTTELLQSLAHNELLSPTAFSMSVHNTASGLYTISAEDRSASTAIAAGADTLEAAFVESFGILNSGKDSRVLLVISDETPPSPFNDFSDVTEYSYAIAFLLTQERCHNRIELTWQPRSSIEKKSPELTVNEPHALILLRFLLGNERRLVIPSSRLEWVWKKQDDL